MTAEPSQRLRWRCRRGTQELDRMLTSFLSDCWAELDDSGRAAFEALLAYEDDELMDWLINAREGPPDAATRAIVARIREHMGL